MGFDEVVPLTGDFGKYQKQICFLLCLPIITVAFHKMAVVFLMAEPNYRCRLPEEFPNASYQLSEDAYNKSFPWDSLQNRYSSCTMFDENNGTQRCTHFIYDRETYGYTGVIEWQLTCKKTYLVATGNAIFMFGVMLGSIIFGDLSDRFGRKPIFFISISLQVIFGTIAGFAPDFWTFTVTRAVVGVATSGVVLMTYVIVLEMVGPTNRLIITTIFQGFFAGGYMLTAGVAIAISDWRTLQIAISLPGIIFFSYWWCIPESARWLMNKKRFSEAKKLVRFAARKNNLTVAEEQLNNLLISESEQQHLEKKKHSALDLFRYPNIRKISLIIFFDWFSSSTAYFGLSWNTNSLAGNPYLNFFISGAVEVPAIVFLRYTSNRYGRRVVMCGSLITAGFALLLTMAVPKSKYCFIYRLSQTDLVNEEIASASKKLLNKCVDPGSIRAGRTYLDLLQNHIPAPVVVVSARRMFRPQCLRSLVEGNLWLTRVLAMVGKLAITAAYGILHLLSLEQFPTVIRSTGMGIGMTCARIGSMLCPYINGLAQIWVPLPMLIFGAFAFTGGLLSPMLPETLNRKLPETIAEGEAFEENLDNGLVKDKVSTRFSCTQKIDKNLNSEEENVAVQLKLLNEKNI